MPQDTTTTTFESRCILRSSNRQQQRVSLDESYILKSGGKEQVSLEENVNLELESKHMRRDETRPDTAYQQSSDQSDGGRSSK